MNGQMHRYRVTLENGQEVTVSSVFDGPKLTAMVSEHAQARAMVLLEESTEQDLYVRADMVIQIALLKTPEAPLFAAPTPELVAEAEPVVEPPQPPKRKPPTRKP